MNGRLWHVAICMGCGEAVREWCDYSDGPYCLQCDAVDEDGDTVPEPTPLVDPDIQSLWRDTGGES